MFKIDDELLYFVANKLPGRRENRIRDNDLNYERQVPEEFHTFRSSLNVLISYYNDFIFFFTAMIIKCSLPGKKKKRQGRDDSNYLKLSAKFGHIEILK